MSRVLLFSLFSTTNLIWQKRLDGETIDVSVQKEIVSEAERLDVKDKAVIVLCELLFKDPLKVQNVIKANRTLFLRVCSVFHVYLLFLLTSFL